MTKQPRKFKLKAIWKNEDIPCWIVCATPTPAIPPEEIEVVEIIKDDQND